MRADSLYAERVKVLSDSSKMGLTLAGMSLATASSSSISLPALLMSFAGSSFLPSVKRRNAKSPIS